MQIAFISANRELLPDACIPIGVLYVIASTPRHHETRLIDLAFTEDPYQLISSEFIDFKPDLVAIGIRNIQNNDYSGISTNLEFLKALVTHVRSRTNAPIVLGGAGFSVMPAELMNLLGADYGIAGEGERLFPLLLESIEASGPAPEGVYTKDKLVFGPTMTASSFINLDQLLLPNRALVDRKYYEIYSTDSVQTSRGCSLHCSYCTYPKIEGSTRRLMNPARVGDEFERAEQNGARHVFIVDSVFNLPQKHARAVCKELIERNNQTPWTCYANPLAFDDELASLMAQAGCAGMEIGADSGCDDVLKSLRKGFTTKDITALHQNAEQHGIADCHTFILGTEGESIDHAKRSLDFIIELNPFAAIIMIWVDDFEAFDTEYRKQRERLRNAILELIEERKDEFPRWIIPSLGVNFDKNIFHMMRRAGMSGPLWQHMKRRRSPGRPPQ